VIELNEAFAAQSLSVMKLPEMDPSKVNVNGGATARPPRLAAPVCKPAELFTGTANARYGDDVRRQAWELPEF
jgi:hypothetical protein